MKLQFKKQQFQLDAVNAIVELFQGQTKQTGIRYMADPGRQKSDEVDLVLDAYRNASIQLDQEAIRRNVHAVQTLFGLRPSERLSSLQFFYRDGDRDGENLYLYPYHYGVK